MLGWGREYSHSPFNAPVYTTTEITLEQLNKNFMKLEDHKKGTIQSNIKLDIYVINSNILKIMEPCIYSYGSLSLLNQGLSLLARKSP